MTGCVVLTLLVLFALFSPCDANPTISTSTPTPCYGDVVTLVCHHPEVPDNPGRYFTTTPIWREDGVGITPFTGVYLQAVPDLTRTTLTINITVDHFRNKSFNYSCLLALAGENGLPTGEVETSGEVTVDPVDSPKKPHNVTLVPGVTSISVSWEHDKSCFEDHTFEFNVTWQEVGTTNEFWSVVNGTNFTIQDLKPGTKYNICTSAVSTSDKQVKSERECQIKSLKKKKDSTAADPGADENKHTSIALTTDYHPVIVLVLSVVATGVAIGLSLVHTVTVAGLCLVVYYLIAQAALVCMVWWQEFRRIQLENCQMPTPVSEEHNGSSELVIDQGWHQANRNQPRTVSERTAELNVTGDGPLPPSNKHREDLPTSKLDDSPPPDDDQGGSSGVAENDSEGEDLQTSEQETSSPPSCIIQPGTGPAPVQFNNSNANNIKNKRWTVSDEHCVESREETPNEELTTIVKTESYALDDQNVEGILSGVANDDSKSEDLRTPEQVIDSSPMVLPKCPPPPKTTPPPDYQGGYSGVTSDDCKTHNDPFRSPHGDTIVSGQYSVYMPPITSGLFMSPFEYKLSDEVLHKREVEEEETMSISVQETPLTDCSPPSTAISIANLEHPEEPLPTAASVASGECPEMLPMALTEYPDVPRTDHSNISPEQTYVDSIMYVSGQTYGFRGCFKTSQNPSQHPQDLGMWTDNKAESVQYMQQRNDMTHNLKGKQCSPLVHWSAHLFQTALHHSGALFEPLITTYINIANVTILWPQIQCYS